MRFRIGLTLGFAAGYVLGAKAGRERYFQIERAWHQLTNSEPAQQLSTEVRHAAEQASQTLEEKANEGVTKLTDKLHEVQAEGGGRASGSAPS
jgi:hypothetical protein